MRLPVNEDDLAACVSCGLCLPHCPTYRVTGEESASPRGRIAAMRVVHASDSRPDSSFTEFMDLCVQCRGCETACPSAVPFGRLMEGARRALADSTRYQPRWRRMAYAVLGHHRLLIALSRLGAAGQRVRLVPRRIGLPPLPLRQARLRPVRPSPTGATPVWLFTGCVMDAWMRPVHASALRVMERAGATVALPKRGADCCGALHVHAGLVRPAQALARAVMASMPGDAPVVVDSAGCGAALKDYGHLVGTPEAAQFAARVRDINEWLAERAAFLPEPRRRPAWAVAVQDPCHLRHVQRAAAPVRTLLAPYYDLVELDDEGLCCGAGGAYATFHGEMAAAIRELKLESVARSGAKVVASANPGCALHLRGAGLDVRHPVELLEAAFDGG
jgi:glycolate oxidase iron-sulfur subunit